MDPSSPAAAPQDVPSSAPAASLDRTVCAFWLGGSCFGLDVALVGELVEPEGVTPVPLAPPAVVGIFNLRGSPLPLVDLADVLGVPAAPRAERRWALVFRADGLVAALSIERMHAVVPAGRGTRVAKQDAENELVDCLLETDGAVVTVLSPGTLCGRMEALRFRRAAEADQVTERLS
jgi:purine-binding chemotaxis protein CheW